MKFKSNRRNFLKLASAGTCGALIHQAVTPVGSMFAYAQAAAGPQKVLIVLNLAGGCSYNLAPIYDGAYRDLNPTISYGPEAVQIMNGDAVGSHVLTPEQGLHPSFDGLKGIYDEGNLALINMVGYPNPNRSHAESTDIWHRATRNGLAGGGMAGWGARLTCLMGSSYAGISLSGSSLLIDGGCNPPRSIGSGATSAEEGAPTGNSGLWYNMTRDEIAAELNTSRVNPAMNLVQTNVEAAIQSAETIKAAASVPLPFQFENTTMGRNCAQAARLIQAASLGVQFIYMERGGFDTHSGEKRQLINNFNEIDNAMTTLANCLKDPSINRWQDVTIVTMSEFCRTQENGSAGTDHGHAAPMLMFGGSVKGGVKNPPPGSAEILNSKEYFRNYHIDFREPFYNVVRHMGLDADRVFTEGFTRSNLDLF